MLKWLASSFGPGDYFSCENHEFSIPGNSVSVPLAEMFVLVK